MTGKCCHARAVQSFEPMTVPGQARSPRPDHKGLLACQMTPHIPDSTEAAAPMTAVCHKRTHAPQQKRRGYSITLSARVMIEGGMEIPSALAVEKLMTSSYFVNISTGRSAGFVPLRIWSTKYATRRHLSLVLTP